MSFYQPLAFPRDADERRHQRQIVDFAGRVRELGRAASSGKIRDVSIGGCRIKDVDLPKDAEIWITLGVAPPRRARIVWMRSGEAGCQFYDVLTRAELRDVALQRG